MIRTKAISSLNHTGPRENQEDYIIAPTDLTNRIFVLCDGMGGHGHGEIASKTVAEAVYDYLTELKATEYNAEMLQDAVDFAVSRLTAADSYNDSKAMGTTLVVAVINRMNVLAGHIGDSRCYLFDSEGSKKFRSKDHSVIQEAIDAEILTEEEAWNNTKKNLITRCIQSGNTGVRIEVDELTIENNDRLMLCSDGVNDAIRDSQIQSIMIGRTIEESKEGIIAECNLSSHDNFSAIIIDFSQDETNTPKKTKSEKEIIPEADPLPRHKTCPHCHKEISDNAIFCPYCGDNTVLKPHSLPYKEINKHMIFNNIHKYRPNLKDLLTFLGGTAVGIGAGWMIFHGQNDTFTESTAISSSNPSNDNTVINEEQMTRFIYNLCEMDDTSQTTDSTLLKTDLTEQYQQFLNTLKNKNSK